MTPPPECLTPGPHCGSYWISGSHNSFLVGHQLTSQSSDDMYRRLLLQGVRSLEIDCWDGPHGDPIVTHGRTLCSKISFSSVAKAIADTAFITSPFPVTLSLEMHWWADRSQTHSRKAVPCKS